MTAVMKQYTAIKAKYPNAILLFRVGDYYEAFNEDAKIVALHLGNTLTFAEHQIGVKEMASIPHYALDTALQKLVKAGYSVAVCDQLEEPKPGPMRRGVTSFINPHRA